METNTALEDYKNKVLERIQALETELVGLKAELNKPKQFDFKYKKNFTYLTGMYSVEDNRVGDSTNYLENFRYRQTETNAEADFQLQKELMCIGALAEQIDPDYKSKTPRYKSDTYYYVYYGKESNRYHYSNDTFTRTLGVVYMTQDVAEKVCEILNNKEVEL